MNDPHASKRSMTEERTHGIEPLLVSQPQLRCQGMQRQSRAPHHQSGFLISRKRQPIEPQIVGARARSQGHVEDCGRYGKLDKWRAGDLSAGPRRGTDAAPTSFGIQGAQFSTTQQKRRAWQFQLSDTCRWQRRRVRGAVQLVCFPLLGGLIPHWYDPVVEIWKVTLTRYPGSA